MAAYENITPARPSAASARYGRVTPLIRQSTRGTSWVVCQPGSARQANGVIRSMNKPSDAATDSFIATDYDIVVKDKKTTIRVNRSASFSARFSNLRRKAKSSVQKVKDAAGERKKKLLNSSGNTLQRAKSEIFAKTAGVRRKVLVVQPSAKVNPPRRKIGMRSVSRSINSWGGWTCLIKIMEGTALASVAFVVCLVGMDLLSAHNFFRNPQTALAAASPAFVSAPPMALSSDPCENGSCKGSIGVTDAAPVNPVVTPPLRGDALRPEDTAVYLQALKVAEDATRPVPVRTSSVHLLQVRHLPAPKTSALKITHKHTS